MEEAVIPGANQTHFGVSAKQKLYHFLCSRPAGADAGELIGLLLSGVGSDPELGARLVRQLLDGDPNFIFDADTAQWRLAQSDRLRVGLDEAEFTVVDLETTGGRAGPGTIIEIGAYRMVGKRLTETFSQLVRPQGGVVPRFITGLTSITTEMIREAPPIEEVLPAFREFMGDRVMVAHNAAFDFGFLDFEFRRIFGIGLSNPVLCTLRMARRFMPSLKRRRLDLLAGHFGLSLEGRHRGLGDARMAAEILSIFLEMAQRMGITRLDRLLDDHHRGIAGRRIERHVPPEDIAATSARARRLPDAQRARRFVVHRQGAAAPGAGELILLGVGEGENRRANLARLQNRDADDALAARGGARRSAADPRAETAVQPDAEIGGARIFHQARYDGRVSAGDALDQDERAAGRDASGAVHRAPRYRAFGSRAVENPRPADVRRQARAQRGNFAVYLRADGALHRALQHEYRRRRIRGTGSARGRFFARAQRAAAWRNSQGRATRPRPRCASRRRPAFGTISRR